MRVPMGLFTVMPGIFGNLVTQIVGMFARIRTANSRTRIGGRSGIARYVEFGTAGIGRRARAVLSVLARLGEIVGSGVVFLFRLFSPGRRNLAHDFVRLRRIRVHDRSHRDIQVITPARGRRLRKCRRNTARKHHSNDGLSTTHAMSSLETKRAR